MYSCQLYGQLSIHVVFCCALNEHYSSPSEIIHNCTLICLSAGLHSSKCRTYYPYETKTSILMVLLYKNMQMRSRRVAPRCPPRSEKTGSSVKWDYCVKFPR